MAFSFLPSSLRDRKAKRKSFISSESVITLNTKGNVVRRGRKKTYESATTFTQNCFPSSSKINEAFSMGARGGSEISTLAEPNETTGS